MDATINKVFLLMPITSGGDYCGDLNYNFYYILFFYKRYFQMNVILINVIIF